MQTEAIIKFKLGPTLTLKDLRDIVEVTKKLKDETRWTPEITRGQRDAEYLAIVIQGDSLLE